MTYATYRFALVGTLALFVFGIAWWTAARPSRLASRLGMRGLKRQKALLDPMWASVEPFVRWAGVRVSGINSEASAKKLDLALVHAGEWKGLTADEYFGTIVSLAVLFGSVGAIAAWFSPKLLVSIPILAMIGGMLPHLAVDNARVERFRAINRGLPYAIDLMALSMSAGLDFPGSVQQVISKAKANEALREELAYIIQQIHLGRTRSQVLQELVVRVPLEAVREFVHALLQAEERGTPVSNALEIQAGAARIRRANLAENAASDMKGKIVLPTMMIVGVTMMVIAVPSAMLIDKLAGGFH